MSFKDLFFQRAVCVYVCVQVHGVCVSQWSFDAFNSGMSGFFHFMPDRIRGLVMPEPDLFQANTNQFPLIDGSVGTITRLMRAIFLAERVIWSSLVPPSLFAGNVADLEAFLYE